MNKYDKLLYGVMKKYGIYHYAIKRYVPYFITRARVRKCLKNKRINLFNPAFNVKIICDREGYGFLRKYIDEDRLICADGVCWSRMPRKDCEKFFKDIEEIYGRTDIYIIGFRYTINLAALCTIYGMQRDFKIVSIYDFFEAHDIFLNGTDYFGSLLKGPKRYVGQLFFYYENYLPILSKMKYGGSALWLEEVMCGLSIFREMYGDVDILPINYIIKKTYALLCEIRDFKSLYEFPNCYDEPIVPDDCNELPVWVKEFKSDIKVLINDIKKNSSNISKDTVVFNWVDNVGFGQMEDMRYLDSVRKQSVDFVNNFAMIPWTRWACRTMFSGKHVIGDRLFLQKEPLQEKQGEYPVYDAIKELGFEIFYFGTKLHNSLCDYKPYLRKSASRYYKEYSFATEEQWRAVTELVAEQKKRFILIHNLGETHPPYISPFLCGADYIGVAFCSDEQKIKGRRYLDSELEWYGKFYEKATRVYMSDHGDSNNLYNRCTYAENRIHKYFFVNKPGGGGGTEERLLSAKEEISVLLRILQDKPYDDLLGDEIQIEAYDIYYKGLAGSFIRRIDSCDKGEWMQHVAIRTNNEKYVLFMDGEERYFKFPNETDDLSDKSKYKDRIIYFRNKVKDLYVDPFEYEYFSESKKLYAAVGLDKREKLMAVRKERLKEQT